MGKMGVYIVVRGEQGCDDHGKVPDKRRFLIPSNS